MKKKVFVGLSGGVDSAVAAHILIKDGYDVTGVFMKNWSGDDFGVSDQCPWKEDLESAKAVAKHLNIDFKIYNFEKEYRKDVISDFFYQYSIGNTPNPDVLCNKYIKFGAFLKRALNEGADYIATGHYTNSKDGFLYKALDTSKDQTYFLYQLSKSNVENSIFPLGKLLKSQIREIAEDIKLPNSKRKDSQGICFVGKIDLKDFLKSEIKEKRGDIIDFETKGKVGEHMGVWFYTIGQRNGLSIGGLRTPYFVYRKDVSKNILYVVKGRENPLLYTTVIKLGNINKLNDIKSSGLLTAQTRYHGHYYNIEYKKSENRVVFIDKAWSVAVGQSVVIFENDMCLGGGTVEEIID